MGPLAMALVIAVAGLPMAVSASPEVALHVNTNNVAGAPWRATETSSNVKYLGLYNTTEECQWACLSGPPPFGSHCCSFTYHTPQYESTQPSGWGRQCFGVIDGHWKPTEQGNITTGKITWPTGSAAALACGAGGCSTALDCGLNGVCKSEVCECRPAWKGEHCQTLSLLPASLDAGYRHKSASGQSISSWGGAVLWSDEDNLWHMFAAGDFVACMSLCRCVW
jgi:hypothetical protein